MASSAPAAAWYYGSINGPVATSVGIAIFAGHSLVSFFDRLSKDKTSGSSESNSDILIRFGDLLGAHKVDGEMEEAERAEALRACLGILEIFSRQIAKAKQGDLSVSLLTYLGSSTTRMKVRYRNPGNTRPQNREVNAEGLLGHAVCKSGDAPRVVNDIREFGKPAMSSPTQSKVDYRSILFYPIVSNDDAGNTVSGFVSIDCKQPYAFFGNRSNDIVVTCEPILSHISELVREAKNGRTIKATRSRKTRTNQAVSAP